MRQHIELRDPSIGIDPDLVNRPGYIEVIEGVQRVASYLDGIERTGLLEEVHGPGVEDWSRLGICEGISGFLKIFLDELGNDTDLVKNYTAIRREDDLLKGMIATNDTIPHVIVRANTDSGPLYIDGTWSQFLGDFGITTDMAKLNPDRGVLPDERIIIYTPEQALDVAEWAAMIVHQFQSNTNLRLPYIPEEKMTLQDILKPYAPVHIDPINELKDHFYNIWNPDNYEDVAIRSYS